MDCGWGAALEEAGDSLDGHSSSDTGCVYYQPVSFYWEGTSLITVWDTVGNFWPRGSSLDCQHKKIIPFDQSIWLNLKMFIKPALQRGDVPRDRDMQWSIRHGGCHQGAYNLLEGADMTRYHIWYRAQMLLWTSRLIGNEHQATDLARLTHYAWLIWPTTVLCGSIIFIPTS